MGVCTTSEGPSETAEERTARELREKAIAAEEKAKRTARELREKAEKKERERPIELNFINLTTGEDNSVVVRAGNTIGGPHAIDGYRWGLRRASFGGIEVSGNPNKPLMRPQAIAETHPHCLPFRMSAARALQPLTPQCQP